VWTPPGPWRSRWRTHRQGGGPPPSPAHACASLHWVHACTPPRHCRAAPPRHRHCRAGAHPNHRPADSSRHPRCPGPAPDRPAGCGLRKHPRRGSPCARRPRHHRTRCTVGWQGAASCKPATMADHGSRHAVLLALLLAGCLQHGRSWAGSSIIEHSARALSVPCVRRGPGVQATTASPWPRLP
jgi:hypothetical protein